VLLAAALLGLLTISALNFYGASLTLLSVADSIKPIQCTVANRLKSLAIAAILAIVIALESSGDFSKRFNDLLAVLLYLFTPWTAINLVDFYWVRKGHYSIREIFNPRGIYGRWNWRGLVAYGIGFVVMIPFFSSGLYAGPIARMSRAFVKEAENETAELPDRPISPHRNLVTEAGLAAIEMAHLSRKMRGADAKPPSGRKPRRK